MHEPLESMLAGRRGLSQKFLRGPFDDKLAVRVTSVSNDRCTIVASKADDLDEVHEDRRAIRATVRFALNPVCHRSFLHFGVAGKRDVGEPVPRVLYQAY